MVCGTTIKEEGEADVRNIMGTVLLLVALTVVACCIHKALRPPTTVSEPFVLDSVEYLQGGFAAATRTVVRGEDGRVHLLRGLRPAPPKGTLVQIVSGRHDYLEPVTAATEGKGKRR